MESIKHKLGLLFFILCLIAVAAVIWYIAAGLPDGGTKDGTLVNSIYRVEMMTT